MGQSAAQPVDEYAQKYSEIKLANEKIVEQAKMIQIEQLFIAETLDMIGFHIKIEREPLNLDIIQKFLKNFEDMKCNFEGDCGDNAYSIFIENGESR